VSILDKIRDRFRKIDYKNRERKLRKEEFVRPAGVRELTKAELEWIDMMATCPYCRGDLYEGPEGGMCVNLLCKTDGCWSRFNYCRFVGQYMGQDKRGF
jgi:hypothetical protein